MIPLNKKNIIIIILAIIVIALAILVAGTFINNQQQENKPVIYNNTIAGLGTFNTTNVTNFTLDAEKSKQTDYLANDTITQVSTISSSSVVEVTISEADRVNDSAAGHTIYKNTANVGEHKGEVRYFSILKDNEKSQYIMLSSPDYNLTCMMADTFKFF